MFFGCCGNIFQYRKVSNNYFYKYIQKEFKILQNPALFFQNPSKSEALFSKSDC